MRRPGAERQIGLPVPETFSVGDAVRYQPKVDQPPMVGKVSAVHEDGSVDFRSAAGGTVRNIDPAGDRLTILASVPRAAAKGGAGAMAAVNVAEPSGGPRAKPTGPPSFRQRILEARAQPTPTAVSQTARAVNEARDDIRRVLAPL